MDNNTNSLNLPQPGELIINNDYLESNKDINKISSIKIIQWNIERGYKMDLIIKDLLKQNADILLLQEIDINCQRSNNINCLTILAEKLKMSYAYVSEFCELYDKVRKDKDQGGGVHGNAIFAKFPISKENTIVIKHKYQPVIWDKEGYSRKEPRKGDRYFISTMFKFNEEEEIFINELLMFINILNCWNFVFINIGIGLLFSISILPMEYLFLHLKQLKYNIIKIIILFSFIFSILNSKQLISSMVHNYLKYNNSIYIIFSITIFFLSLRIELFILMIINNFFREQNRK
jgi:hypothetical protein